MIKLSLVIPVYNEAARLESTFKTLNKWRVPQGAKIQEVIFVNDGSTDRSLTLLKKTTLPFKKTILSYRRNQGKGYAVRQGMKASTSPYTIILDADMATHPRELKKILPFMIQGIDVVVGTRRNGHSTVVVHQPALREFMGKIYTKLSRFILDVQATDFTCGFKAFSFEAKQTIFKRARINRWGYDSEILYLASRSGFTMVEKAVTWSDQKGTKVHLFQDSLTSFKELLQIKFYHLLNVYNIYQNRSAKPVFSYP